MTFRKKWLWLLFLTLGWILAAVIVNPLGEFPINDDWAYAKDVYHLAVNGVLKLSDWPAMTLIAQTLWGALFCKIFGFSFTILRLSVLFLGLTGIIFYYLIALRISGKEKVAFFTTLVLAVNPVWFSLSYSFMTDVPFLSVILGSVWFFMLWFGEGRMKYLLLATFMALIATMIRQLGILVMISAVLAFVIMHPRDVKRLFLLVACTIMVFLVMQGFTLYLTANKLLPANYASFKDLFAGFSMAGFYHELKPRTGVLLMYAGFFLGPLVVFTLPSLWKEAKISVRLIVTVSAAVFIIPAIKFRDQFPVGNILYNTGLSPKLLKDTYWGFNWRPSVTNETMSIIRIVCLVFVFLFLLAFLLSLFRLFKKKPGVPGHSLKVHAAFILAGYLGFLLVGHFFFDRYFLPFIVFLSFYLVSEGIREYRVSNSLMLILFAAMCWFSVSATHDFMSFNRARWQGLSDLTTAGISPHNIDGGFEFNGWYETGKQNPLTQREKSWWFVDDDTYAVTQGPMIGYRTIKAYHYTSFLSCKADSVLIGKRFTPAYKDSTVISCNAEALTPDGGYFTTSLAGFVAGYGAGRTDKEAHSGHYSLCLDKDHPYGMTMIFKNIQDGDRFVITAWTKNNPNKAGIVAAAPETSYFYSLSTDPDPSNKEWKQLSLEVSIYQKFPSQEISIYLWDFGGEKVYFDDLTIRRFKYPGSR